MRLEGLLAIAHLADVWFVEKCFFHEDVRGIEESLRYKAVCTITFLENQANGTAPTGCHLRSYSHWSCRMDHFPRGKIKYVKQATFWGCQPLSAQARTQFTNCSDPFKGKYSPNL